jgi:hypothetical protein
MRRRRMQALRPAGRRAPLAVVRSLCLAAATAGPALVPLGAAADPLPITYSIEGIQGANGWYRGSDLGNFVVVRWTINVAVIDDCSHAMKVDGPTAGTTRSCTVTLSDGSTLTRSTGVLKIDADPPVGLTATPARAPDHDGWYNHPVAVSWSGSDATSGIAGCTSLTYAGPEGPAKPAAGGCTDVAGNTANAPVGLNYDATAPVLDKVAVTSAVGRDVVRWRSSSPSDTIVVRRSARGSKERPVVYRGSSATFADAKVQPALEYTYTVQALDQAGNASKTRVVTALPKVLSLRKTPYVPRAAATPVLRWDAARGATYYHVQLFRGSKRILAAWPVRAQLQLPKTWRWNGRKQRLGVGRYRWYVWAGLGRRSFARYRAIGHASFVVPR